MTFQFLAVPLFPLLLQLFVYEKPKEYYALGAIHHREQIVPRSRLRGKECELLEFLNRGTCLCDAPNSSQLCCGLTHGTPRVNCMRKSATKRSLLCCRAPFEIVREPWRTNLVAPNTWGNSRMLITREQNRAFSTSSDSGTTTATIT